MHQRNENSVLFSLAHLQQMAMATSANAQARPSPANRLINPRPVVTTQPAIHTLTTSPDYVPVSLPSSVLMSPRARWPRWLAPVIVVLGLLFISVLVLALAIALRPPTVKPVLTPPEALASPEGKLPDPSPEKSAVATPVKAAEKAKTEPIAPEPKPAVAEAREAKPEKKLAKSKKRSRRSARLRRRRRRRRRRARARRRRKRRRRIATRSQSGYKPYRKLGHDELDAILSSASR
jgi:hypothetical protein